MKKRNMPSLWTTKWQKAYLNRSLRLALAFEWLREQALRGNDAAAALMKEIIRLNRPK